MPLPQPVIADAAPDSIILNLVDAADAANWLDQNAATDWAAVHGWQGQLGKSLVLADGGRVTKVAIGNGSDKARKKSRFGALAALPQLPQGTYMLEGVDADTAREFALAWALSRYKFDTYAAQSDIKAILVCPKGVDADQITAIAEGECLTRDLINIPSNDMGPAELQVAAQELADRHGASMDVVIGTDLIDQNFPMIHTVGRASHRSPRLLDMTWGDAGPRLTLVGKGVCFDTGGLNIKPGASMGLMKKDMGGAAHVLGLAHMIMASGLPVQLRVLIPAVENSIGGDAYRPQDILHSRKGLTVEINNTDAEGRLVLADTLTYAVEEKTDLVICMATLTGAARVAVGPDIAPYFTDDHEVSHLIAKSAAAVNDPVWQMPFHTPYEAMIEPGVADLDNAPKGGFAGAITAALFLRRFVNDDTRFVHFDCSGWQFTPAPGRPKGGVGQGTRALFDALPKILNL